MAGGIELPGGVYARAAALRAGAETGQTAARHDFAGHLIQGGEESSQGLQPHHAATLVANVGDVSE